MSGFSADWLALREPYDARARNRDVLDSVAAAACAAGNSVAVVDLACGTGSTLRAIAPRLPARQDWRLVDNDLSLLARAASGRSTPGIAVTRIPVDLTRDLEAALDGPVNLVTASALLDLVSADWLERLAVEVAARCLPLYAALTYDGRLGFDPVDPLDSAVVAAVNLHQQTDKGFGPALGPAAAEAAIARFRSTNYAVVHGRSDWHLTPRDRDIQLDMLAGWAGAAREIDAVSLADAAAWLTRRRDLVAAGCSAITVGHVDIFARPIGTRVAERSQSNRTSSPRG
ncbi:MAG TPA: class I SAM-dependent methyltransferase [Xanthobacteraceae bacterium]|nr:class I SAM-dependent methyltransferase [Xanthobacteraceae bacterium]